MQKLIIACIIGAITGPGVAFAEPIVVGRDVTNCVPMSKIGWSDTIPPERFAELGVVRSPSGTVNKWICRPDADQLKRLYDLEVAVQALQARNAQLEANNGATGAVPASLEARVTALEKVTKSIQESLVMVINMLAQALSSLRH